MDSVTALLTVPEVEQLEKLANEKNFHQWQHPLFKPIFCRIEDLTIPTDYSLYGYSLASFNLVEHREPGQGDFLIKPSSASARAKADAAFADLGLDLDGLADIPGTAGTNLSDTWDSFGDAYEGLGDAFDAVEDGSGIWRDLSRSLDTVTSVGEDMISAVRDAEEYLENGVQDLVEGVSDVVQTARDAVETLESAGKNLVTFAISAPTDLYGLVRDAGLELTEDVISTIMSANGIEDPLAILPGMTITMPTVIDG